VSSMNTLVRTTSLCTTSARTVASSD
jgi:hypothetical protein